MRPEAAARRAISSPGFPANGRGTIGKQSGWQSKVESHLSPFSEPFQTATAVCQQFLPWHDPAFSRRGINYMTEPT